MRRGFAALSLILLLDAGCGETREGDPCDSTEPVCGENDLGYECRDGKWKAVCHSCRENEDGAPACVVSVCTGDDPTACD